MYEPIITTLTDEDGKPVLVHVSPVHEVVEGTEGRGYECRGVYELTISDPETLDNRDAGSIVFDQHDHTDWLYEDGILSGDEIIQVAEAIQRIIEKENGPL
ncbi:hypothetical protein D0C36_22725 [Mucilaginibacter conchicola]|uniref:Uncharacterized protein n=2 Tax=Mucilaginibacter conchicola TaxID=2303333 RepID=A0A372NN45_9SPHI|nr:hypothetical protein D0C36_22725 [Mucilaginibacter conchicola]